MIEATCTACGTVNRIADADVPVGAKFVNCASCKSRVGLPVTAAGARPPAAAGPLDLADLPAPRRSSPLGGGVPHAQPAPRSGLDAADAELPVPRTKKPSPSAAAAAAPGSLELDDLLGPPDAGADLPAPRPKGLQSSSDLPAPKPKTDAHRPNPAGVGRAMTDLPVPGIADTAPLVDLPSPKPKLAGVADLPAPRPKMAVPAVPPVPRVPPPVAAQPPGVTDLPGPKPKAVPVTDLPGPRPKPIPVPAMPGPPVAAKPPGIVDLPMPKHPAGIVDLPMPKPGQPGDLPMPKPGQAGDLPAPKGFFEDLPQPARGGGKAQTTTDVAPKGFFDDLPQPAHPSHQTNDIAPKGFFDDLPGRPNQQKPEVPAPKGFFDDLPGRPNQQKPEVPAPKGFFDDLPKPAATKSRDIPLDSLELEPAEPSNAEIELDALDLENDPPIVPRPKAPSAAPAPGPSNQFDDLDLSSPSPVHFQKGARASGAGTPNAQVATINPAAAAAAAAAVRPALPPVGGGVPAGPGALELEEPRGPAAKAEGTAKLGPKQREEQRKAKAVETKQKSARSRKVVGIALLAALALGGGGYFAYRHFAKKAEQAAAIDEHLGAARKAISASQWSNAAAAANKTLELDKHNAEAFGIRAEALFALGVVEGNNAGRFGQARKSLADALEAGVSHPALERAQALSPLALSQPDKAIAKLKVLAARAPKDPSLQLYLGWAYAALGEIDPAVTAFDGAVASPTIKVHALLGRAHAKQSKGDLEGARADYTAILEAKKDHVGAQVGLASSLPAQQAQQQEADLLAILQLKDVEKREPGASMQAWILAAELARKGGRLDVSRERYRKALAIQPADIDALVGLAAVELQDKKLDVATELIDKALKAAPTDIHATLAAAEIAIAKKQYDDAGKRLEALAKRTPPPPVLDQARIKGLEARLLEAQGKEQDAIDAYLESAKLAGEQDLTPTLTAAAKLLEFADKAAAANDVARSSELRKKADQLLEALSDEAMNNPTLALTLGMAYLQASDPVKAETWLRKAIELQPKNVDAMYQLAKALTKQGKDAEAIAILRNAVELDPTRSEIGLELARTYEDARPPRVADAEKLYEKLLAAKEPTLELRARAGRFFARIGQMEKAGEQGQAILKQQDDHPAGLYLKGEGMLGANKTDAARKLFVQASDADPEPQYFDARGRASEAWAKESGNTAYQDDALRSYAKAVEKDPTVFSSWLGQGRLYVSRKEDAKALAPLQKAWELQRTAEVARLLGIAIKQVNAQPKVAADWLEQSINLEPHPDTAYNLGELYRDPRLNDPKKAIFAFDRAVKLALDAEKDGNPPPAWLEDALYELGNINNAQNNLKAAKSAWEKWLQRSPKPGARLKEVKQLMATSLKDL